ncbi:unnamed protein product, partial [marine sediment metagenome]
MAYLHIANLYKEQEILLYKECYALEKIHGTSANISWSNDTVHLFSGGAKYESFAILFDKDYLNCMFNKLQLDKVKIYGEAYGGKQQGMRKTYGDTLKFIAFEVKVGTCWLAVPQAEDFCKNFILEFVHYVKIPTTIEAIDAEMNAPSVQAKRNGILEDMPREGVVLRTLIETTKNNGERIIAKHKHPDFRETKTKREVTDPLKLQTITQAKLIAEEWVTEMRLSHV